ncbi:MAG TPA: M48 family metalloprotease, partial [Anaerolineales bacterium]|nr:M48 family metalloprotease [Anaerolineales bacterium]
MSTVQARLNPFLFSPDTNFRFILLIVSVLGASLFGYYNLYNQFQREELRSGLLACLAAAEAAFPTLELDPASPEYTDRVFLNNQFNNECNEPMEQFQARWILRWLGLFLLVAGILYWLMPILRIRRDLLRVFSEEDDPEIMTCLHELTREIGLSKIPVFLLRALNPSRSGLAFGRLGQYFIVLNGGLITLYYQDQNRFRTIVLHELAHLRNYDVDKTYFSVAVVISFLLVTLIPLSAGNIIGLISNFRGNITFILWQILSAAIFLPVIYIALASILRSREIYADARVLAHESYHETLKNELASLAASPHSLLNTFFGLHPKPAWRLKVLDESDLLLGLSGWDALLAGFISSFALRELDFFLSILIPARYENYSFPGASLFFIPFVASVVGVGVWQKVFVGQVRSRKLSGYGRYGLSLGAGLVLGISFSFSAFIENSLAFSYSSPGLAVLFNVFLGMVLLASLFLLFRWVALGADVWLET